MNLLESIKARQLEERKKRSKSITANVDDVAIIILTVLLGDLEKHSIQHQQATTDKDVVMLIRRLLKINAENKKIYGDRRDWDMCGELDHEREILVSFLPKQLSKDDVADAVIAAIVETGAAVPKEMGKVMGLLKRKYNASIDMQLASDLTKTALELSEKHKNANV